ncbi:MAG: helix-turn-helix transcriptional regulator [Saprospiraceae bacterium]|nr:helix-turn-helix transcriptional regulator [Saprospiraceae bacterium]
MRYQEQAAQAHFSRHIECFWELDLHPDEAQSPCELLVPDCTFDLIFCSTPIRFSLVGQSCTERMSIGANFIGQKTTGLYLCPEEPQRIFGVRFKPFALAHLFPIPPQQLTDKVLPLQQLFQIRTKEKTLIEDILSHDNLDEKVRCAECLVLSLFDELNYLDQQFREQLNYILERKGILKIQDLFGAFGVSKVTLHKHFLNKMGLSPKQVSRIWRLNYFLQLQRNTNKSKLTDLALKAGYYDQAHFIREFNRFFPYSPHRLLQSKSQLLQISQEIIDRRFSNLYDPIA